MKILLGILTLIAFSAHAGYETNGAVNIPEWVQILEDPVKPRIAEPSYFTPKCRWCSVSEETKQIGPDRWSCVQGHIMNQRGNPALPEMQTNWTSHCQTFHFYSEYVHNAVYRSANWKFQSGNSRLGNPGDLSVSAGAIIYPGWWMPRGVIRNLTADIDANTFIIPVSSCGDITAGNWLSLVRDSGGTFDITDYDNASETVMISECTSNRALVRSPNSSPQANNTATTGTTGTTLVCSGCSFSSWGIAAGAHIINKTTWAETTVVSVTNNTTLTMAAASVSSGDTFNVHPDPSSDPGRFMSTAGTGVGISHTDGVGDAETWAIGLTELYSGGPPMMNMCDPADTTFCPSDSNGDAWIEEYCEYMTNDYKIDMSGTNRSGLPNRAAYIGDVDYHNHGPNHNPDAVLNSTNDKGIVTGGVPAGAGVESENYLSDGYDAFYACLKANNANTAVIGGIWNSESFDGNLDGTQHEGSIGGDGDQRTVNRDYGDKWGHFHRHTLFAVQQGALSTALSKFANYSHPDDIGTNRSTLAIRTAESTATTGTTGTTLNCSGCTFTTWSVSNGDRILNHDNTKLTTCTVSGSPASQTQLTMSSSGCVADGDAFSITNNPTGSVVGNEQHTLEILGTYALGVKWYSMMPIKDDNFGGDDNSYRRRAMPFQFVYTDQTVNGTYAYGESTMVDPRTEAFSTYSNDLQDMVATRGDEFMGNTRVWAIDIQTVEQSPNLEVADAVQRYSFDDDDADGCDAVQDFDGWESNLGSMTLATESSDVWTDSPIANTGSARCALKITTSSATTAPNSERVRGPNTDFGIDVNKYYLRSDAIKITGPNVKWRPYTARLEAVAWHENLDMVMHDQYRFWPSQFFPNEVDTTVFYAFSLGAGEAKDLLFEDGLLWEGDEPFMGLWLAVFDEDGQLPYDSAVLVNLTGKDQTNIPLFAKTGQCWQEPIRPSWDGAASAGATWSDPDNWMQGRKYFTYPLLKNETARLFIPCA